MSKVLGLYMDYLRLEKRFCEISHTNYYGGYGCRVKKEDTDEWLKIYDAIQLKRKELRKEITFWEYILFVFFESYFREKILYKKYI